MYQVIQVEYINHGQIVKGKANNNKFMKLTC